MAVTFVDNAPAVIRALEDAQGELIQRVREEALMIAKRHYKAHHKDPHFGADIIGKTTVALQMGQPGIWQEYGTAVRGEPGKASGKPYTIPKGVTLANRAFGEEMFPYRKETYYRIEYRTFRTKSGKVKSVPKKVKMEVERGRRPGKKALFIPGVGFRAVVWNHPGIFPKPIIRPTMAELQDRWEKIANDVFEDVVRRYRVAARD